MLQLSPKLFVSELARAGTRRVSFVRDRGGEFVSSLQTAAGAQMAAELRSHRDFLDHEALFVERWGDHHLFSVAVHSTNRGQSCGGIRYWPYEQAESQFVDALRLATGMARKSALAGLWHGGGKAVIATDQQHYVSQTAEERRLMFQAFGLFVSSLRGLYVAAEDVGCTPSDLAAVLTRCRFATCFPAEFGGSGNPSRPTARGVAHAMEGALSLDNDSLEGKTVAVQGCGNVAQFLMRELVGSHGVARVVAADVNEAKVAEVQAWGDSRVQARAVAPDDTTILREPCDVLAPCALGGVLTEETAPQVRAAYVVGAANNQLLVGTEDQLLPEGAVYVPDFVANRMGIVNCANEQYGSTGTHVDQFVERHYGRDWENSVFNVTRAVLGRAKANGMSTNHAAEQLADDLIREQHPLWPGRNEQIRLSLLEDKWASQ